MDRKMWQRLDEALRAVRRHIQAGEPSQALQALDLAEDCVAPLREQAAEDEFNTEVENWR